MKQKNNKKSKKFVDIINLIDEHEDKLISSKTKELKKNIEIYKIKDFIK